MLPAAPLAEPMLLPLMPHIATHILNAAQGGRTHKSWPVAQIAELHHARYLLQPRAIELFMSNGSSALLSFATAKVCSPHNTLLSKTKPMQ